MNLFQLREIAGGVAGDEFFESRAVRASAKKCHGNGWRIFWALYPFKCDRVSR